MEFITKINVSEPKHINALNATRKKHKMAALIVAALDHYLKSAKGRDHLKNLVQSGEGQVDFEVGKGRASESKPKPDRGQKVVPRREEVAATGKVLVDQAALEEKRPVREIAPVFLEEKIIEIEKISNPLVVKEEATTKLQINNVSDFFN